MESTLIELDEPVEDVETLRLIEARAAVAYFGVWQALPMRWKGTARHPIPKDWLTVGQRQSLLNGSNRNATHPLNALLNYTYGVLESQVRITALSKGIDPTIGYIHVNRPGRVAFVYDLMEPLRPEIDELILDFIRSQTLSPSDFVLSGKGVCRLHPQMARRVASMCVDDRRVSDVVESACSVLLSGQEPAR
jgi:CRISP-associated protein Cas1